MNHFDVKYTDWDKPMVQHSLAVEDGHPSSAVEAVVGTPSVFIYSGDSSGYLSRADTFAFINALLAIIGVDGRFEPTTGELLTPVGNPF